MRVSSEYTVWIRAFITLEVLLLVVLLLRAQRYNGHLLRGLKWVFLWNCLALAWYVVGGLARLYGWPAWIGDVIYSDVAAVVWIPYALSLLWLLCYCRRLMRGGEDADLACGPQNVSDRPRDGPPGVRQERGMD